MPSLSSGAPNQPFLASRAVSAMPATAVGSAKGTSTMHRAGAFLETCSAPAPTPASAVDRIEQRRSAAMEMVTFNAASVRGSVRMRQNPSRPSPEAFK